jgi:formylmethanofuran dehydrogenase subunit E
MSGPPSYDDVVAFHGHDCPGLAVGYRVALVARERLRIERAPDEEIVAVVENLSCAVDAIQVVLGCTVGKGNLILRDWGKHVYTIHNRATGEGLRISVERPADWRELSRDEVRRALLEAPPEQFLKLGSAPGPLPEKARVEPSEPCAECGEGTMASRLVEVGGRRVCVPCAECDHA